jgi:phage-related protein
MWEVEYYIKPNGRCPVEDFLKKLSLKTDIPFVVKAFERLEQFGHYLDRPHSAYLRDKIYELRIRTQRGQLRFLYFFFEEDHIVITHGFHKKTGTVPDNEIKKAIGFMNSYFGLKYG